MLGHQAREYGQPPNKPIPNNIKFQSMQNNDMNKMNHHNNNIPHQYNNNNDTNNSHYKYQHVNRNMNSNGNSNVNKNMNHNININVNRNGYNNTPNSNRRNTTSPYLMNNSNQSQRFTVELCYGDKVRLRDGREGDIKFIGTIGYKTNEIWYGIHLKTNSGNCNGIQQNRLFFHCPPGHGLFAARHEIANILSYNSNNGQRFSYGQRIKSQQGIGIIKFIGEVQINHNQPRKILYGIELKKQIQGGNNGIMNNILYFQCKPFHGIFHTSNEIILYPKKKKKKMDKKRLSNNKHSFRPAPSSPLPTPSPSPVYNNNNNNNNRQYNININASNNKNKHINSNGYSNVHSNVKRNTVAYNKNSANNNGYDSDNSNSSDSGNNQTNEDVQNILKNTNFTNIFERYRQTKYTQISTPQYKHNKQLPPNIHINRSNPQQINYINQNHNHKGHNNLRNPIHYKQTQSLPNQHNLSFKPLPQGQQTPTNTIDTNYNSFNNYNNNKYNKPLPVNTNKKNMNTLQISEITDVKQSAANILTTQPFLSQSQSVLIDADNNTVNSPIPNNNTPQYKSRTKYASLKAVPDSPFDVRTTQDEFAKCANNIFTSYNNPRGLFKILQQMSEKLKLSTPKYRVLDPCNPAVEKKVFKRQDAKDGDMGPESVKEFLTCLGFQNNNNNNNNQTGLYICPSDQPPISVIDAAINVCKLFVTKCNNSRKALHNIRKYSKNVNVLRQEIRDSLKGKNIPSIASIPSSISSIPSIPSIPESEDEKAVDEDVDGENDRFELKELIWSITHDKNTEGANVRDVLLLCHPVFLETPKEILNLLQIRFFEIENWEIQYRVTSCLQHWIRKYYYQDFYLNPFMEALTEDFVEKMRNYFEMKQDIERGFKLPDMIEKTMNIQLNKLKEQGIIKQKEERTGKLNKILGMNKYDDDIKLESIKNKKYNDNKQIDKFYSKNYKQIAIQFVLMSYKAFKGIQPRECLETNWKGAEKEQRAPNIIKVINQFNAISNWIQMTILSANNASKRGKWITKWLKIAEHLFELHDFQTLAAIHGALTSQTIFRQTIAWKKVPAKYIIKFEEFKVVYNSRGGHSNLRKIHGETVPPFCPYSGVLLQVLFQIDEGNKSKKQDGSVNFSKLMRLHNAIQRITLLQNSSYDHIKHDDRLQEFLSGCLSKYSHYTPNDLYKKSTEALNKDDPKRLQNKK